MDIKKMKKFDHELDYIEAAASQVENYLLSKELYRPIGITSRHGEKPFPALTIGNLLLATNRAGGFASSTKEKVRLSKIQNEINQIRHRWAAAWQDKVSVELSARLKLWSDFLEEYRKEPGLNFDRYRYEVSRRVIIHLLSEQYSHVPDHEAELLSAMDRYLRAMFQSGEFTWDDALEQVFPESVYWYLYGRLPA
jgi:hypothetical protein